MTTSTISALIRFQQTGQDFETFWGEVESHLGHAIRGRLRQHLVRGWKTRDDLAAVEEVEQQVRTAIFKGARPGGSALFNPARGRGGVAGLQDWLSAIVQNETASYCRKYRADGRRRVKLGSFTDFALNDRPGVDSVLKDPVKFDPDRFELVELVNACVQSLPDLQQQIYQLRFIEGLSVRDAGERLRVAASTVSRQQARLHAAVLAWFRDRRIDASGLL